MKCLRGNSLLKIILFSIATNLERQDIQYYFTLHTILLKFLF